MKNLKTAKQNIKMTLVLFEQQETNDQEVVWFTTEATYKNRMELQSSVLEQQSSNAI